MNFLILRTDSHSTRSIHLSASNLRHWCGLAALLLLMLCLASFKLGSLNTLEALADNQRLELEQEALTNWNGQLTDQALAIENTRQQYSREMDVMTLRLGELQAKVLRLDALGQRLADNSSLPSGEFDFNSDPSVGGPESTLSQTSFNLAELDASLGRLELQTRTRQQQLEVMSDVMVQDRIDRQQVVAGKPVEVGWLSSRYGFRSDPFTGKKAWHSGLDFAGADGSDIVAVASGVIVYAGRRLGYGKVVEVAHGDGLVTRYAHCKELLVTIGDVVEKDQTLALMGSTGRSTGPHVHFEVLQNGKSVDPGKYVSRGRG